MPIIATGSALFTSAATRAAQVVACQKGSDLDFQSVDGFGRYAYTSTQERRSLLERHFVRQ